MYCLFIDSGIEPGVVALIKGDVVLEVLNGPSKDPAFPFVLIDKILKKASLRLEDIQAIGVGVGPGSFTGVRTSVSVAQAISYARKIPLLAIPTPFRYIPEKDGKYIVALDARQGGAFCLEVEVQEGKASQDFLLHKFSLDALVAYSQERFLSIVADRALFPRVSCEVIEASETCAYIGPLCHAKWQKKEYTVGVTPDLKYLGATQAENNFHK